MILSDEVELDLETASALDDACDDKVGLWRIEIMLDPANGVAFDQSYNIDVRGSEEKAREAFALMFPPDKIRYFPTTQGTKAFDLEEGLLTLAEAGGLEVFDACMKRRKELA
jgi:hypothetical protein